MEVEASLVSETTKRDACALGSCEQRKFAPDPIQLDAMLAALKLGVTGMIWGLPKKNPSVADLGPFTIYKAHGLARQSRCGNN